MKKAVNEKTFELNITSELINLSKSFLWYLDCSPICHLLPRNVWSQFLNNAVLFAEGLTQEEESDPVNGGYDVSINCSLPNGSEGRLMFLQFKAGIRKKYSTKNQSVFNITNAKERGGSTEHILFTINDAAGRTQHSTLQTLSRKPEIQSESVMYVFPRITEKSDFNAKIGSLTLHSSFIPITDIDNQASSQTPSINILDGHIHKYRTSYDGLTSEMNFFFFGYSYDNSIISKIIAELICIQIERLATLFLSKNLVFFKLITDALTEIIEDFIESELQEYPERALITTEVSSYIENLTNIFDSEKRIPRAPSEYTTIIPREGLKLTFEEKPSLEAIQYQIF